MKYTVYHFIHVYVNTRQNKILISKLEHQLITLHRKFFEFTKNYTVTQLI